MIVINETKTSEENLINFDSLCQEFDGQNFYGLEYILEDFFQNSTVKSSIDRHSAIDWFGLYG